MGRLTRTKRTLPVRPCACGRSFTTRSGRSNHARHCPAVWVRNAEQLARMFATLERARERAERARTDP